MRVGSLGYCTGVYCILNLQTGKRYVGSAGVNLYARVHGHRKALRRSDHKNSHLQNSWNRYGESSFCFFVLRRCPPEDCIRLEQEFIDKYRSADRRYGYNRAPAAGSVRGLKHGRKTRERLSRITKDYWKNLPSAERERISKERTGRKLSEETKAKLRGRRWSHEAETLERMREFQKTQTERKKSQEMKDKLKAAWVRRRARGPSEKEIAGWWRGAEKNRGKKRTEEYCRRMSEMFKGRPVPQERRDKISATLRGRNLTSKHRLAIKNGLAGRKS
jgi:group I intron endonuclease